MHNNYGILRNILGYPSCLLMGKISFFIDRFVIDYSAVYNYIVCIYLLNFKLIMFSHLHMLISSKKSCICWI